VELFFWLLHLSGNSIWDFRPRMGDIHDNRPFLFLTRGVVKLFVGHEITCGQIPLITFVLGVELTPLKKPFHQTLEVRMTPQKFSNI
jgi:hypothetical protein